MYRAGMSIEGHKKLIWTGDNRKTEGGKESYEDDQDLWYEPVQTV